MLRFQPLTRYKEHGKSSAYLPNLSYSELIYITMYLKASRRNWAEKVLINI